MLDGTTHSNAILVVGSLHYDIVVNASHLPAIDETVMGNGVQFVCGGKGGNQAVAASRMGAKTYFAGAVGEDFFADALITNLTKENIDISLLQKTETQTSGMSVAIVKESGDYGAVAASGANLEINAAAIVIPADAGFLILQNEIPEKTNTLVAKKAKQHGLKIILNAAPMRNLTDELLAIVDILVVNTIEAHSLLNADIGSPSEVINLLDATDLPGKTIIVTMGSRGLVYRTMEQPTQVIEAPKVSVVSTHGAGDCFVGALCAELAIGCELEVALRAAIAAAALYVSTPLDERKFLDPKNIEAFRSNVKY